MKPLRGMSLIDVIVGTALVLIIFLALFGLLKASVNVSSVVKDEATALAVANTQMEYIRSLPYTSVGTVGGIPAGSIAQIATTTEDNSPYIVRTFVQYYDDPADGLGAADTNGITEDYKQIKVTVTYNAAGQTRQITLNSIYAPPGIETTVGGGTLQINVVNAVGVPVSGASVTITNSSVSPSVNVTTFSDINGHVSLPGAATSTQYAVTVTKSGYSTAQTYARAGANQNPNPGYLTVVGNQTTSATFAIDLLSTLTIRTYSPIATSTFSDNFNDSSKIASSTNTYIGGGLLTLGGGSGGYNAQGMAISTTTSPAYLYSWGAVNATPNVPSGTSLVVQVVDGSGNLIPDAVLPGNAAGFTTFPINLYGISTTTYPALALEANLQTTSTSTTPSLSNWSLSYQAGPIPLPNVSFTLTGAKTIGTTGASAPIYKTNISATTDSTGTNVQSIEWDSYTLGVTGYNVVDACASPPFAISPGTTVNEALILSTSTPNSLLVTVSDSSTGLVVPGATVTLTLSGGYTSTVSTSACGTAYFGSLSSSNGYSITISKSGYTSNTASNIPVSGDTFYADSF